MKKLLLLAIAMQTFCAFGQSLESKEILKTGLFFGVGKQSTNQFVNGTQTNDVSNFGISFTTDITYGKVSSKDDVWHYGIGLDYRHNHTKSNSLSPSNSNVLGIGPVLGYQKFIAIVPKIYYSPEALFVARFGSSKDDGTTASFKETRFFANASITPFNISFLIKKNIITNFSVGKILFDYNTVTYKEQSGATSTKSTSTNYGFNVSASTLQLGVIFILNPNKS